jgi:FkbM family methyltransferase
MTIETGDSTADDTVSVEIPGSKGARQFRMALHQRCDLVAATIADGGWEAFERPMPRCFFNYLAESPGLVIDGGINTGYYAFLACAASDLNFVLGFEPDATVRKFLWQNIFLNQLTDRISVSPLALSNRIGLAELYVPDPGHGLIESSSSLDASFKDRHSGVVRVGVSTLDAVLSSDLWQAKRVTAIKIDVEGHELSVLEGAAGTIAKWRPVVFVEILDRAHFSALSALIARFDYWDVPLQEGSLTAGRAVAFHSSAWNHAFVPTELLRMLMRSG